MYVVPHAPSSCPLLCGKSRRGGQWAWRGLRSCDGLRRRRHAQWVSEPFGCWIAGLWSGRCLYNNNASAGPPTFACNVTFTLAVAARPRLHHPPNFHTTRPAHVRPIQPILVRPLALILNFPTRNRQVFGIHLISCCCLWISSFLLDSNFYYYSCSCR